MEVVLLTLDFETYCALSADGIYFNNCCYTNLVIFCTVIVRRLLSFVAFSLLPSVPGFYSLHAYLYSV